MLIAHEVQPGGRGRYQEPFNRGSQGRQVPVHNSYDRQSRSVGTPDDVDDEKFVLFLLSLADALSRFHVSTFPRFHLSAFALSAPTSRLSIGPSLLSFPPFTHHLLSGFDQLWFHAQFHHAFSDLPDFTIPVPPHGVLRVAPLTETRLSRT